MRGRQGKPVAIQYAEHGQRQSRTHQEGHRSNHQTHVAGATGGVSSILTHQRRKHGKVLGRKKVIVLSKQV